MPLSGKASASLEPEEIVPRRIRHLTSIHVANFTPFPVRDEFTSALSKPSEQPQYADHGHLSDDLDVTLGRKRGRRRSATLLSATNLSASPDSQKGVAEHGSITVSPARKRTPSKASIPGVKIRSGTNGPPIAARPMRQRTISASSSNSHITLYDAPMAMSGSLNSMHGILRDTSQPALEKILSSRLVETFITVSVPAEDSPKASPVPRRNTVSSGGGGDILLRPSLSKRGSSSSVTVVSPKGSAAGTHTKAVSVSSPLVGQHSPKPTNSRTMARKPSPRPQMSPRSPPMPSGSRPSTPDRVLHPPERPIPDYLSAIHRPSVNPSFNIDARTGSDFAPGTNLSGCKMTVEIWAHQSGGGRIPPSPKGKGKERADWHDDSLQRDWKVLETWNVNLNDLQPFPGNASGDASHMPPNTLCVTLDPPGKTFYLPTSRSARADVSRSRSPSPSAGYNSDPESNIRGVKSLASHPAPRLSVRSSEEARDDGVQSDDDARYAKRGRLKSAGWQDLLKLVTLQAVIRDTEHSLSNSVREVQSYVLQSAPSIAAREASERQAWVNELHGEISSVRQQSDSLRSRIAAKSNELRLRREALRQAHDVHAGDLREDEVCAADVALERARLSALRAQLPGIRNSLFTNLASIYPIELVSPPDLLFTILDVPLPIPTSPTDPAPPLSLPAHKEITEDTVATALGYAAQVVQLLAAYLGQGLTYPVTCIGSRSLIKDGISMMVGPRMFPLFSKGVDTYRFEYGVFLLNKDIELLMSERNLRALDVRHTLPNLKNLLLTLTDPDTADPRPHRPLSISSSTISALQSPLLTPSDLPDSSISISDTVDTQTIREQPLDRDGSPPPSGSTTPTKTIAETPVSTPTPTPTSTIKKPRGFLDLSGFFRGRQPSTASTRSGASARAESSSRSTTVVEQSDEVEHDHEPSGSSALPNGDTAPTAEDGGGAGADDEDDRRTIRASASEDAAENASKVQANGHVNGNGAHRAAEKLQTSRSQVVDVISSS